MQYALLIYGRTADPLGPISAAIAEVLDRPYVTGWARLYSDESATTLRNDAGKTLLTDGPFIDSKEYLAGLIVVDAANLDGALEVAQELQDTRTGGSIEVRPIFEGLFRGT
jgi:hypothetical protein